MRCMADIDAFVSNKDDSSSIVASAGPLWKRDPLMSNKRQVGVPLALVIAQEFEDI